MISVYKLNKKISVYKVNNFIILKFHINKYQLDQKIVFSIKKLSKIKYKILIHNMINLNKYKNKMI